jgi:hypothetical protein
LCLQNLLTIQDRDDSGPFYSNSSKLSLLRNKAYFSFKSQIVGVPNCRVTVSTIHILGCQKLFFRPPFTIVYIFLFSKTLFCLKMDQFKFSTFVDIPACLIVIRIHVKIKRIFIWSEKLNIWFKSNIIYLKRVLD